MALPTTSAEIRAKQVPHGAVDPNVKIPQQILDAGKRSEAIQQAIAGDAEPSIAARLKGASSRKVSRRRRARPTRHRRRPTSRRPTRRRRSGGTPDPQQQPQPEDEQTWQQQFRSLSGRTEAEARRARDAITSLSNRLEQLERENCSAEEHRAARAQRAHEHAGVAD